MGRESPPAAPVRVAFETAVHQRRDSVKRRQRGSAPAGFEGAGQRADHATATARSRYGERQVFPIEPLNQALGQLYGAAAPPGLLPEPEHHRPAAHQVACLVVGLEGQEPGFGADMEGEGVAVLALELERPAPGQGEDVGVRDRQRRARFVQGLGHDRDRHRPFQPMVEIAQEAVANPEQLVGKIAPYGHINAGLEPLPEPFNILCHMITSRKNSHLKTIRRLGRSKGDHALLEGPHLIGEALEAGHELRSVLATPRFLESTPGRRLVPRLPLQPLEIDERLLAEVTDSDSPRGIVAVARLPHPSASELPLAENGTYLYVEGLQDPGNLGALVRVAEASGVTAVCLSPGSVLPNHPRALRASAGSLLRLPVAASGSAVDLADRLAPLDPTWAALVARGGRNLFSAHLAGCVVLALGAEGAGLTPELQRRADLELTIPLQPPVESLNAAVAAAVALFELRRRRLRD